MPHLHLPFEHSDADLALAASLAEVVGSEDLYVVWTHDGGAGAVPEVAAVMRESSRGPLATLLGNLVASFVAAWHALVDGPPSTTPARPAGARPRPAEEPSA